MKKRYTGKEDFSQNIKKFHYEKTFVLNEKAIKDITQYVYNKKDYPFYLNIVSDNELKNILIFLKLRKDILNILKDLKSLKENLVVDKMQNIHDPKNILRYKDTMKKLKDYRYVYHKALPYYIYTYKKL